jgi:hypothetical protein
MQTYSLGLHTKKNVIKTPKLPVPSSEEVVSHFTPLKEYSALGTVVFANILPLDMLGKAELRILASSFFLLA